MNEYPKWIINIFAKMYQKIFSSLFSGFIYLFIDDDLPIYHGYTW